MLAQGGLLHEEFRRQIRATLKGVDALEPAFRKVWDVLASEDYATRLSFRQVHETFFLIERIKNEPWTPILQIEALRFLAPIPVFRDASPLRSELRQQFGDSSPLQPADLVSVDMELVARREAELLCQALLALPAPARAVVLGDLAAAVTGFLAEILDWFSFLELGGSEPGPTTFAMPSIEEHPQNHHYETWTWLIDLVREGVLALHQTKPELTRSVVAQWHTIDSPLFRRLTLFAATYVESVGVSIGAEVLAAKNNIAL